MTWGVLGLTTLGDSVQHKHTSFGWGQRLEFLLMALAALGQAERGEEYRSVSKMLGEPECEPQKKAAVEVCLVTLAPGGRRHWISRCACYV